MGLDSFIGSLGVLGSWFKRRDRRKGQVRGGEQVSPTTGKAKQPEQEPNTDANIHQSPPPGFFANATNVVINHPIMAETFTSNVNMLASGNAVLQHLAPFTNPDAAVDSSARWPPPACHPGTRVTIGNTLMNWLDDLGRQWSLIWLYGSAGCGKSAVAQTFAEKCVELGRLGATFFFSRPNKRNDPKSVIPTLAYQLATHCPEYKAVITSRLADDPQLLSKAIPIQFKKLIIEPFTHLQHQNSESIKKRFLILLDGLDECQGEAAQCEFIKLIDEVVRVKKDLPLLWLVCSRPEAHLQHTFTRITDCGREELSIDEECRNDVDRYLRDGFYELQLKYNAGPSWPPAEKFDAVSKGGSGHFVFAATALSFIGDETYANPVRRLDKLVAFLEHAEDAGVDNPLAKLDFLYTCILSDIPSDVFPITWRVLAHFIYAREIDSDDAKFLSESAQALCNFVNVDQSTFYGALRKLYSVVDVPSPGKAGTSPLRFYHASFQDFLVDSTRSGRFFIGEQQALVDITKSLLFWHEVDAGHFHTTDGPWSDRTHDHIGGLPGLKWTSGVDVQHLSEQIFSFSSLGSWMGCVKAGFDRGLLSCIIQMDPRYLEPSFTWVKSINCYQEHFPSGFCRTEPSSEFDVQLLDYLARMTNREPVEPASFPLVWHRAENPILREYLLIGHGDKSVIVWYTDNSDDEYRLDRLTCDQAPSPDQISEYQDWLQRVGWYEGGEKRRGPKRMLGLKDENSEGTNSWK